jgi:hypothetical protein
MNIRDTPVKDCMPMVMAFFEVLSSSLISELGADAPLSSEIAESLRLQVLTISGTFELSQFSVDCNYRLRGDDFVVAGIEEFVFVKST